MLKKLSIVLAIGVLLFFIGSPALEKLRIMEQQFPADAVSSMNEVDTTEDGIWKFPLESNTKPVIRLLDPETGADIIMQEKVAKIIGKKGLLEKIKDKQSKKIIKSKKRSSYKKFIVKPEGQIIGVSAKNRKKSKLVTFDENYFIDPLRFKKKHLLTVEVQVTPGEVILRRLSEERNQVILQINDQSYLVNLVDSERSQRSTELESEDVIYLPIENQEELDNFPSEPESEETNQVEIVEPQPEANPAESYPAPEEIEFPSIPEDPLAISEEEYQEESAFDDNDDGSDYNCGNGNCDAEEDCNSCPMDCYGNCGYDLCGNGVLDEGEDCEIGEEDCSSSCTWDVDCGFEAKFKYQSPDNSYPSYNNSIDKDDKFILVEKTGSQATIKIKPSEDDKGLCSISSVTISSHPVAPKPVNATDTNINFNQERKGNDVDITVTDFKWYGYGESESDNNLCPDWLASYPNEDKGKYRVTMEVMHANGDRSNRDFDLMIKLNELDPAPTAKLSISGEGVYQEIASNVPQNLTKSRKGVLYQVCIENIYNLTSQWAIPDGYVANLDSSDDQYTDYVNQEELNHIRQFKGQLDWANGGNSKGAISLWNFQIFLSKNNIPSTICDTGVTWSQAERKVAYKLLKYLKRANLTSYKKLELWETGDVSETRCWREKQVKELINMRYDTTAAFHYYCAYVASGPCSVQQTQPSYFWDIFDDL